jgi:peptidoglycan/xylan/chitin deacetylase (PgdA/CDA1 family)
VTIIMYHSVSAAVDPYTLSPSTFRRQIECIADAYRIVRLSDVRDGSTTPGKSTVVITFDDAFGDFCEAALPVLEEFSVPCTLFVPTGCIGGWNAWDDGLPGIARKRIMTVRDLRAVCATGLIDLGSHTVDHPRMSRLSRREMHTQALMSKRFLEDTFGVPIDMFSYPYGQRDDFSPLTSQVLAEVGYDVAVTTCWGTRNSAGNLLTLPRVSFAEQDTVPVIRRKIDGYYNWIGIKETLGYAWRSRFGTLRPGGVEDTWTQRARPSRGN